MEIFIRPLDTQFYRSGLPFDAGENDEAVSFFPPYPRTLYGALRTKGILAANGDFSENNSNKHVSAIYGDKSCFGSFAIKGPFIVRFHKNHRVSPYLPFPLDVVAEKDGDGLIHLCPSDALHSQDVNMGWDLKSIDLRIVDQRGISFPLDGKEVEALAQDYYLAFDYFANDYLISNNMSSYGKGNLQKAENIFSTEDRIGIARSQATRTAIEGRLYRSSHTRMDDKPDASFEGYGLFVKLDGYDSSFPEKGLIQLGGEFRAASYFKVNETKWWERYKDRIVDKIAETGRFKAYFITPAIFKQGSLPDVCKGNPYLDIQGLSGKFRFNLISVSTAKPKMIGGWDIKKKKPKAMRLAVPEGSVYFFQYEDSEARDWKNIEENTRNKIAEMIYDEYNFQTWCSKEPWGSEYGPGKEGFGIAMIGGW